MNRGLVLFSGGGTVGHLAPGFALAEALGQAGFTCRFATPGEAHEGDWFEGLEAPLTVAASRLPRKPLGMLGFVPRLLKQIRAARRTLDTLRPRLLVALGGWPCVPLLMAARKVRVPVAMVVADAVPGLVVRKAWKRAALLLLQDARAEQALPAAAPTLACGALLRRAVLEGTDRRTDFGLDADLPTLLVLGGSLGARGLYERFFAGLEAAVLQDPGVAGRFQVIHAAGRETGIAARYARLGVRAHVAAYFPAVGDVYRSADLALCRAGAGTTTELAAVRLPAVFVPYPHHADRQQFLNAEPLVACGGARLVAQEDFEGQAVSDVLDLLLDEEARGAMRDGLQALPAPDSGQAVAALVRLMETGAVGRGGDPLVPTP